MFAMDSDGVGRASETVCSRSVLVTVSSHGVGLESGPLSPVPLPLSNAFVVGIVACPAGSGSDTGSSPSTHTLDQNVLSTILWKYPTDGFWLGEHTLACEAFRCV